MNDKHHRDEQAERVHRAIAADRLLLARLEACERKAEKATDYANGACIGAGAALFLLVLVVWAVC